MSMLWTPSHFNFKKELDIPTIHQDKNSTTVSIKSFMRNFYKTIGSKGTKQ